MMVVNRYVLTHRVFLVLLFITKCLELWSDRCIAISTCARSKSKHILTSSVAERALFTQSGCHCLRANFHNCCFVRCGLCSDQAKIPKDLLSENIPWDDTEETSYTMSKPLILGLGPYDASGSGQVYSLPSVHRLVPLPALSSNYDLHLRHRMCVDLANPDANQCCGWRDGH